MQLNFSKMQGLGNDFVVLDNRELALRVDAPLARRLADRKFGIGCDQLLLVERPTGPTADLAMRIFNSDGSEVEHCGNGARALARYAVERGLVAARALTLELPGGCIHAEVDDQGWVTVDMGDADFEPASLPFRAARSAKLYTLDLGERRLEFGAVSVGNPHAVIEVADVGAFDLHVVGPALQAHPDFPSSVNVGAAEVVDRNHVRLRVYERGVGETLACGTGACAAMAVLRVRERVSDQVRISLPGGDLSLEWAGPGKPIAMGGPADFVFDGWIEP